MQRILFVISALGAGGAERVIAQVSAHWVAQGKHVAVASFDCEEDPIYHTFDKRVILHRLGSEPSSEALRKRKKIRDAIALRKLVLRERPDVIVPFLTKNIALTLLATIGTDVRIMCSERNNPERQRAHWLWSLILEFLYPRASLIVCQTKAVRRCLPKSVHGRIFTIPNPIAPWPVTPAKSGSPAVVAAGRLTHQKGFDILIEAFAKALPDAPEWRLEIWGEGRDRASLQRRIDALGLNEKILLKGISKKPGEWVLGADMFVMSSRFEGFCNVLGEAMAAGLPCISTRCDFGPEEMMEDMVDGVLVAPEDVGALADALRLCMNDAELRERVGKAAKVSAQRYAPDRVLRLWDTALGRARASGVVEHPVKERARFIGVGK